MAVPVETLDFLLRQTAHSYCRVEPSAFHLCIAYERLRKTDPARARGVMADIRDDWPAVEAW